MQLKLFPTTALVAALLLISATGAAAQVAPISGKVTLKQADGSVVPVSGALIDIYRTDLKWEAHVQTNRRGDYMQAGLPFIGTYTIAVSAPGARPDYRAGVRPAQQPVIDFELAPGDGARLTLEQIKTMPAGAPAAPPAPPAESAEARRVRAELERKNAEIMEQNRKIEAANEIVDRTFKAGNDALAARNYDAAIAAYNEGLAAREEPALYSNKSIALRVRGVERYNAAINSQDRDAKDAGVEAAKKDWVAAAEAGKKAFDLMSAMPVPSDPAEKARYDQNKLAALAAYAEAMRLVGTKVDTNKVMEGTARGEEAFRIYSQYAAQETDPAKKSQRTADAAKILYDAGNFDRAIEEYRKIIAKDPDSLDANIYLGIALFNTGEKKNFQESADFLQRFLDLAANAHPMKADAQSILDFLKTQENITPRRRRATPSTPRRRP